MTSPSDSRLAMNAAIGMLGDKPYVLAVYDEDEGGVNLMANASPIELTELLVAILMGAPERERAITLRAIYLEMQRAAEEEADQAEEDTGQRSGPELHN